MTGQPTGNSSSLVTTNKDQTVIIRRRPHHTSNNTPMQGVTHNSNSIPILVVIPWDQHNNSSSNSQTFRPALTVTNSQASPTGPLTLPSSLLRGAADPVVSPTTVGVASDRPRLPAVAVMTSLPRA